MNARATLGLRLEADAPSQETRAFVDAHQSETATASDICEVEAPSVVDDRQLHPVFRLCQCHADMTRPSVLRYVAECLLGNPVQAQRHVGPDARDVAVGAVGHVDRLPVLKLCGERTQRRVQIRVLEQSGMQLMGELADFIPERQHALLDGRERSHHVSLIRPTAKRALDAADHDRQNNDPLTHVIMEIARNPGALGFPRSNQSA